MTTARVLVVCVDAALAGTARSALRAVGYDVRVETDSLAGLVAVEEWQPALVVLDWALPFIGGWTFVHALMAGLDAPPPVVALDAMSPVAALAAGARVVVAPDQEMTTLVRAVDAILSDRPDGVS